MQPEDLATPILVMLTLGLVFYAGYGWRMLVERRLHNMPWLKKSARKATAAAAKSTKRPTMLRAVTEPLERPLPATDAPAAPVARGEIDVAPLAIDEPQPSIAEPLERPRPATDAPAAGVAPAGIDATARATSHRVLSLRRTIKGD